MEHSQYSHAASEAATALEHMALAALAKLAVQWLKRKWRARRHEIERLRDKVAERDRTIEAITERNVWLQAEERAQRMRAEAAESRAKVAGAGQ